MKYVSLVLFTLALVWTWNLVHTPSDISFETHSGIQEKLAGLITDTIKAKRPSASDIVIQKIWTEVVSNEKVKAFFIYSFKDNSESGLVTSEIRGEGLLERKEPSATGEDHWVLSKVQTSSDAIQFDDATIITGSSKSTEDGTQPAEGTTTPTPATPEAPKSEEKH
jgi:hypothetical protein